MGAGVEEIASITHAERTGMEYKNLIGTEIRKRRSNLGWSQSEFAVKLQLAGLDLDRSQVSKIECRLVHVSDYEQVYLAEVLKISISELFPPKPLGELAHAYVPKTMKRRRPTLQEGGEQK